MYLCLYIYFCGFYLQKFLLSTLNASHSALLAHARAQLDVFDLLRNSRLDPDVVDVILFSFMKQPCSTHSNWYRCLCKLCYFFRWVFCLPPSAMPWSDRRQKRIFALAVILFPTVLQQINLQHLIVLIKSVGIFFDIFSDPKNVGPKLLVFYTLTCFSLNITQKAAKTLIRESELQLNITRLDPTSLIKKLWLIYLHTRFNINIL